MIAMAAMGGGLSLFNPTRALGGTPWQSMDSGVFLLKELPLWLRGKALLEPLDA